MSCNDQRGKMCSGKNHTICRKDKADRESPKVDVYLQKAIKNIVEFSHLFIFSCVPTLLMVIGLD